MPSLSKISDLSCITSCLVLPGFLMDTLLSTSSRVQNSRTHIYLAFKIYCISFVITSNRTQSSFIYMYFFQRTAQYLFVSSLIFLSKHLCLYGHKEQIVMSLQFISFAKITAAKDLSMNKSLHKYFKATIIVLFLRVHTNRWSAKESCESGLTVRSITLSCFNFTRRKGDKSSRDT